MPRAWKSAVERKADLRMRFLIVKPSSLGDVLHAFPAVHTLCRETGGTADWLIHPAFEPVLKYLPEVRRTILFDRKGLGSFKTFLPTLTKLRKELKKETYDAVIDLQGLFRSAWFAGMAPSKVHAGPANPREGMAKLFYNTKLEMDLRIHAVVRNNRAIAGFLKKDPNTMDFSCPLPPVPEYLKKAELIMAEAGIPAGKKIIGIATGTRWVTKQWEPEFFAEIVNRLGGDYTIMLLGTKADSAEAQKVKSLLKKPENAFDLCGKSGTGDLVELIRKCSLLLCNDSGPMHIGAALDVPVLSFFGPTSPELTGPYSEKAKVLQPDLDCIRCFQKKCANPRCHYGISAEYAAETAAAMLVLNQN